MVLGMSESHSGYVFWGSVDKGVVIVARSPTPVWTRRRRRATGILPGSLQF